MMTDRFENMRLFFNSCEKPEEVGQPVRGCSDRVGGVPGVDRVEILFQAEIDQDGGLHHWTWVAFPGTEY